MGILEENIGAGRKGEPRPSRPKAGIEARGRRGGIGFVVPRQIAQKQVAEPVKRNDRSHSVSTPAGSNGNTTNAGSKSQDDFRKMMRF